ncbi:MAG: hypothetical protein WC827_04325 [Candidatus Paceibacterota bacterium]|jgi:hypothetical protein
MRICTAIVCMIGFFLAIWFDSWVKLFVNPTFNLIAWYFITTTSCLVLVHQFAEDKFNRIRLFFSASMAPWGVNKKTKQGWLVNGPPVFLLNI